MDAVLDRLLPSVYDAIDNGNIKSALKLLDAAAKKTGGRSQIERALRAACRAQDARAALRGGDSLALHEPASGPGAEAVELLRGIVTEGPEADRVVAAATHAACGLGRADLVLELATTHAARYPADPRAARVAFAYRLSAGQPAEALRGLKIAGGDVPWWRAVAVLVQAADARRAELEGAAALGGGGHGGGGAAPSPTPASTTPLPASLSSRALGRLARGMAERAAAPALGSDGTAAGSLSRDQALVLLDAVAGERVGAPWELLLDRSEAITAGFALPADAAALHACAAARAGARARAAALFLGMAAADPSDSMAWEAVTDVTLPEPLSDDEGERSWDAGTGFAADPLGAPQPLCAASRPRARVGISGGLAELEDFLERGRPRRGPAPWAEAEAGAGAEAGVGWTETTDGEDAGLATLLAALNAPVRAGNPGGSPGATTAIALARLEVSRRLVLQAAGEAATGGSGAALAAAEDALAVELGQAFAAVGTKPSAYKDLQAAAAALRGPAARVAAASGLERLAALVPDADGGKPSGSGLRARASAELLRADLMGGLEGDSPITLLPRLSALRDACEAFSDATIPDRKDPGLAPDVAARVAEALLGGGERAPCSDSPDGSGDPDGRPDPLPAGGSAGTAGGPEGGAALESSAWAAVAALAASAAGRPHAGPQQVGLLHLLGVMGAPGEAASSLEALGVKSILLDSVASHAWFPAALASGVDLGRASLARELVSLGDRHATDGGQAIEVALASGALAKVPEMTSFGSRVARSAAAAGAIVEAAIARLWPPPAYGGALGARGGGGVRKAAGAAAGAPGATELRATALAASAALRAALATRGFRDALRTPADLARISFNEDLSLRPAWAEPLPVPPRLESAAWWEDRARRRAEQASPDGAPAGVTGGTAGASAGAGQAPTPSRPGSRTLPWWTRPGAAGASRRPGARRWRAARLRSLGARAGLADDLARLLAPPPGVEGRAAAAAAPRPPPPPTPRGVCALEVVVPHLVRAREALDAGDSAGFAVALEDAASGLEDAVAAATAPGAAPALALLLGSAVGREEAYWMAAALEAWRGPAAELAEGAQAAVRGAAGRAARTARRLAAAPEPTRGAWHEGTPGRSSLPRAADDRLKRADKERAMRWDRARELLAASAARLDALVDS